MEGLACGKMCGGWVGQGGLRVERTLTFWTASSSFPTLRDTKIRFAPFAESISATARPIPSDAPVRSTVYSTHVSTGPPSQASQIGPFTALPFLTLPSTGMRFLPKNPIVYAEYKATAAAARIERCANVSAIGW